MNKYQKALNTIVDAMRDYISYRESDLLFSENEIYGAMALLWCELLRRMCVWWRKL